MKLTKKSELVVLLVLLSFIGIGFFGTLFVSPMGVSTPLQTTNMDTEENTLETHTIGGDIIEVQVSLTIHYGVRIALGSDKSKTCPSPEWNFMISYEGVGFYNISSMELVDLDQLIENTVQQWIDTIDEKGVRKQLERRGIVISYIVVIEEVPM